MSVSKISNHAQNPSNPDNSVFELKGQKGVGCLVEGYNTPKDGANSAESKVTRILIESYMKRPAVTAEAMNAIFERANNGLMVNQSPQYPSYASASAVFLLKNKFVYASAGDNVIFHFVDGKIADVFCVDPGEEPQYLGVPGYASPKVSDAIPFTKGNHTFLICTGAFAQALNEDILEGSLSNCTHLTEKGKQKIAEVKCDRWLRELQDNIPNYNSDAPYSAIAFSVPPRKKSKLLLIIIIIAAVVLIGAGFFIATGAKRRPPQGGPGQGQEEMLGPNGERPPEPPAGAKPGDQQPEPPTRPPQN